MPLGGSGVEHRGAVVASTGSTPSAFTVLTGVAGLSPTGEGILDGWSFAVKDNIDVAGYPTTLGISAFLDNVADRDATVVARLRRAGGIVVGKSVMYELALGNVSSNPSFGALSNPFDASRSAGGSSGGSAVSVAVGAARFALGTDTGGSIRTPAAMCGIVGFRPSTGRYPMAGVAPLSPTRDTVGVLAGSVVDVGVVDSVLSGEVDKDYETGRSVIVGIPSMSCAGVLDGEVALAYHAALDRLRTVGCRIRALEYDPTGEYQRCERTILLYEATIVLGDYLRHVVRPRVGIASLGRLATFVRAPLAASVVARIVGGSVPSEAEYEEALRVRHRMVACHDDILLGGEVDVLAYPTLPIVAPPLTDEETTTVHGERVPLETLNRWIGPSTVVGSPAITVPVRSSGHLPVGMSFESGRGTDRRLLDIVRDLEKVLRAEDSR